MAETDLRAETMPRKPAPSDAVTTARKPRERLATAIEVPTWLKAGGIARHGCGQSLWLQVRGETASWLLRYRYAGRAKSLGLGACDPSGKRGLKLAEARTAADRALALLREGTDPAVAKRVRQAVAKAAASAASARPPKLISFRDVARDFIEQQDAGWRNAKHAQQWANTLETYAYPVIGSRPPEIG